MILSWIEAHIFFEQGSKNDVLITFIRPLVRKLRPRIISYHFFLIGNYIRFRVLTHESYVDDIKALINKAENLNQVRQVTYPEIVYEGEIQNFEEDGWLTTYARVLQGTGGTISLSYALS